MSVVKTFNGVRKCPKGRKPEKLICMYLSISIVMLIYKKCDDKCMYS